ncbi:lysoplasmalogenase [Streptomyces sp. NRRL F-5123]|uniref:lysoplasmalogenase n=1 Tax=Streptomyces sp. NRRL F-5123 TaxID=1463856 RepID=UPI0007C4D062|nr:lysoplasmalogenase [Streptomyces sp. NRRL F-5123]
MTQGTPRGTPQPDTERAARVIVLFAMLAAVHMTAVTQHYDVLGAVTKPLLMPALAWWVLCLRGPRLLVAALLCGCGGDVLLDVGGTVPFLLGMASFAAGHICYLRLFTRLGSFRGTRTAVGVRCAAYGVVWAALVVALWPGLDAGMRVPVALYSVLLTAMAAGAYGAGPLARAGGLLFLLSDSLIATDLADWPLLPGHGAWVMATYLAGQWLLAFGVVVTVRGIVLRRSPAAAAPARP